MEPIPVERVLALPAPGLNVPASHRFVGDTLFWLAGDGDDPLIRSLWSLDLADPGAEPVRRFAGPSPAGTESLEEQLRRERLRDRAQGVTGFRHAGEGRTLVARSGAAVFVERVEEGIALGSGLRPFAAEGPVLDPTPSPDGRRLAFVREGEVWVSDLAGSDARALTSGAAERGCARGLAEFVAQEEMHRSEGLWWSKDGSRLAYAEVDERHVPIWRIPHEGAARPAWEDHRYPFAGADNARVSLHVVPSSGGAPVRMDLSAAGEWEYLARVAWMPDGALVAQLQDRRQRVLTVLRLDPETGEGRVVLTERGEPFVALDDLFRPLVTRPGAFLWGSERSGHRHLYRVAADGRIDALTSGEWQVDDLLAVDEAGSVAYVLATADGPTERHLYEISLDPSTRFPPRRLTPERGMHDAVVDVAGKRFVAVHGAVSRPPRAELRHLADGAVKRRLHDARSDDPSLAGPALPPPELHTVRARTGEPLHAALYRPDGPGPHPVVVMVYGGPGVQRVFDAWAMTADLRAQRLRSLGFAVLKVDNRGSARRGRAFVAALCGETGRVEIEDQADALRQLAGPCALDLERVGITGGSYGGYLTLMALLREPELFRAGVAIAPVTHWDGYDTHYTERYMGLPAENPGGYEASSVLAHVDRLRGELLLVHGMRDENVHLRHSGRLINALVAADKRFEMMLLPDERHMTRGAAARRCIEERLGEFFVRHLASP